MASEKAWKDWPDTDIEAGWYVKDNHIFNGYSTGEFKPNENISLTHFQSVLTRAEIDWSLDDFLPITEDVVRVKTSQKIMPGTAWSANPESLVTRYRAAVMIYRFKNGVEPQEEPDNPPVDEDAKVIAAIEQLFQDKPVTYQGVKRYSKLVGLAHVIVEDARKYNVPIWLCLAQSWRESQWFTTGLSINYNCGWGIKDSKGRWGELGSPTCVSGYSNYSSEEEAVHAYFRLMGSEEMPYKSLIDSYRQTSDMSYIYKALDIYAPGYENDTYQHHKIVSIVKEWCVSRGIE